WTGNMTGQQAPDAADIGTYLRGGFAHFDEGRDTRDNGGDGFGADGSGSATGNGPEGNGLNADTAGLGGFDSGASGPGGGGGFGSGSSIARDVGKAATMGLGLAGVPGAGLIGAAVQ